MIPNLLSLSRIPLGIAFFFAGMPARFLLTMAAALSDGLDGYLARKLGSFSKLGTLLDPLGDKVFAVLSFGALYLEGVISLPLFLSLFSREIALVLFSYKLWTWGELSTYQVRAFFFGKVMTTCQFILLLALILGWSTPFYLPFFFFLLGVFCCLNLFLDKRRS